MSCLHMTIEKHCQYSLKASQKIICTTSKFPAGYDPLTSKTEVFRGFVTLDICQLACFLCRKQTCRVAQNN